MNLPKTFQSLRLLFSLPLVWAGAFPGEASGQEAAPPAFQLWENSFEFLAPGPLDGQSGWTAPDGVSVAAGGLDISLQGGGMLKGGNRHLLLDGSPEKPVNDWAVLDFPRARPDDDFYLSFYARVFENTDADPSELFIRLNEGTWDLYMAVKAEADIVEVNGTTEAFSIDAGATHHYVFKMMTSSGSVTSVEGWINPAAGSNDQPDFTVGGLNIPVSDLSGLEIRSQKTESRLDQIVVAESWDEIFETGIIAIETVAELGPVQYEGMQDEVQGGEVSPHLPEEEPDTVDSVPYNLFQAYLEAAFAEGLGGVANFEPEQTQSLTGPSIGSDGTIRFATGLQILVGDRTVDVGFGPNQYIHAASCSDGYTGKDCENPSFIDVPPMEDGREDRYPYVDLNTRTSTDDSNLASSGTITLTQSNSYDLLFDPEDRVVKTSFTYINYDNFQSQQDLTKPYANKPNIRVTATFSNGEEEMDLVSTGLTEWSSSPANTFFGFEAPANGYYLTRLQFYAVGNNGRIWASLDDLAVILEKQGEDLFTFTYNNEGRVDGLDRPIQAANWDGIYSSGAFPLETDSEVFADLSEGVTGGDNDIPGSYKAGFLFVSGKAGAPAPEGYFVFSDHLGLVSTPQNPANGVNPQTDWYSAAPNSVSSLGEISFDQLRELTALIRPRDLDTGSDPDAVPPRFHFAIKAGGSWYVAEEAFSYTLSNPDWETVSVNVEETTWLTGVVGDAEDSLNLDFASDPPVPASPESGASVESIGYYIDTDDNTGETNTWFRVNAVTVSAELPTGFLIPPVFSREPESVSVQRGETVVFEAAVHGDTPVSYQWFRNDSILIGETESTLTIGSVSDEDGGTYTVEVTGEGGTTVSSPADLTLLDPPEVSPASLDLDANTAVQTFSVTADPAIDWISESPVAWISVDSGSSGSGDGSVSVFVAPNSTALERSATLVVAGVEIPVTQAGVDPVFEVEDVDPLFSAQGGGLNISVNATEGADWTATSDAAWLTLPAGTSYTGSAEVEIMASAHNGLESRMASLVVAGSTIEVTQMGTLGSYFAMTTPLDGDARFESEWFGVINAFPVGEADFVVYSEMLETFLWMVSGEAGAFWVYHFGIGDWAYVQEEAFPWMYQPSEEDWFRIEDGG